MAAAVLLLGMAACNAPADTPTPAAANPTASPTLVASTPTPEPAAARVNGEPIPLETYQRELERYESAMAELGIELATLGDYRTEVLQRLIERKLLAQAAQALGNQVSDADVDQRFEELVQQRGGSQAMASWMQAAGYSEGEFRGALMEEMLAARMIQTISEGIASDVEQVHARHILVATEAEAQEMLDLLDDGADFGELAAIYSLDGSTRPAGGDLGWFPRNSLTVPEVEQAAFELQPGQISGIAQSELGYHVIELLERERRPLAGNALIDYRSAAVERWLDDQRQSATIEIYVES